jgi:UDP-3-O-[3-hydroxymyristoyl] glucosamine N-acyltransferase
MPSLAELAELVGGRVLGDGSVVITRASGVDNLQPGDITLGGNEKAMAAAVKGPAAAVIVAESVTECAKPALRVANPRLAFAQLLTYFAPKAACVPGIHPAAVVGPGFNGPECEVGALAYVGKNVTVGKGTVIHPGAVIYDNVTIGEDTVIYANVVIREGCRIGNRVIIQAGSIIGADGFGYATVDGNHYKIPQVGIVVIEDEVEIGALTAIDRATSHETVVKRGAKIDNLVQIGHNCKIGESAILCGQVGLAGSTEVGRRVTLAGKVGVVGHNSIGDDTVVAGYSKVHGDVPAQSYLAGVPARPYPKEMRIQAALGHLPELMKEVRELRKIVTELRAERNQ